MIKKLVFALIVIVVAVEGYFLFQTYQNQTKKYTGETEKIALGAPPNFLPSLVWIAENKGYFQQNGVEVSLKEFDSGKAALTAMLNPPAGGGGLDMATVAQTPVMFESLSRDDFAIVSAMVSSYNDVRVLARRGRGITRPGDLRGKKIGVTKSSTGQYFLDLLLNNNNMKSSDVEEIDLPAGQLASNIIDGTVDAVATWQLYINNIQRALGDKVITFPTRKIFREDFYFVTNRQFLQNHQEAIIRFLKGLGQAEDFAKANKNEAMAIVSKRLGLAEDLVVSIWDDYQFGLFLDQTVIQTLESEAAWAIQNKLTDKTTIPNYLNYISVAALKAVAPEKVLIKR